MKLYVLAVEKTSDGLMIFSQRDGKIFGFLEKYTEFIPIPKDIQGVFYIQVKNFDELEYKSYTGHVINYSKYKEFFLARKIS